jgi:hypothetical protein
MPTDKDATSQVAGEGAALDTSEAPAAPPAPPAPKLGRRPKLTAELAEALCTSLVAGNFFDVSCKAQGVAPSTVYAWLDRGRRERARLELLHAEGQDEPEPLPDEAGYLEFLEAVEKSQSESQERLVGIVANAAIDHWQAATWMLERRFPKQFGLRVQHAIDEELTAALDRLKADLHPDEYAKVLRSLARLSGS